MVNIMRKSLKQAPMVSKLSQLGKIFIIPIFFTVSIYTAVNIYSYSNIDSNLTKLQNIEAGCNYFIPGSESLKSFNDIELNLTPKEIYVIPDFKNIHCLNRIGELSYENSIASVYVYTNTKFINFMIFFTNFFILALKIFIKTFKRSEVLFLYLVMNIGYMLNFSYSLSLNSYNFMLVTLLIIYFKEVENSKI